MMGVAEERAQATVEMAVMAPVLIIVALIVYNLMVFISATARFDRVAPDIVLAHGASPVGGEGAATAAVAATVKTELERAMGTYDIEVEVSVAEEEDGSPHSTALAGGRPQDLHLHHEVHAMAPGARACRHRLGGTGQTHA